jgi:hypothetical protein
MDHVSYLIDRQHRFLLIAAGIIGALGIFVAGYCYPPIDMETSVPLAMLLIVFVPLVLARVAIKLEESKKIAGVVVAIVLCISAAFLILNGSLDTYPPAQIDTRVIAKFVGYRLTYGVITVAPSWRDGRTEENLPVSSATFYMVEKGQSVQIVVHRGAFGLPWFSSVLPE